MFYGLYKLCGRQNFVIYNCIYKSKIFCSTNNSNSRYVKIGSISKSVSFPNNPELVPCGYLPKEYPQSVIRHLQWIMQKDLLGQDIFLIGLPGPMRRRIIFQYLEMTQREAEYVVLSRDTTESDLKQRREIKHGSAHYVDQSAVKAAVAGRVLVLDGIEKAERNVLPILNNLLENREIQLEDGHFLLSASRYDKLLQEHSKEVLDSWKLVRVSEDFRVVALGLPVPLFRGNPLDPPFRSRFQARDVRVTFEEQLFDLSLLGQKVSKQKLSKLLSFCHTLLTPESVALGLPKFPVENLPIVIKIMNEIPNIEIEQLIKWMYPYFLFLGKDGQKVVMDALKTFDLLSTRSREDFQAVPLVQKNSAFSYSANFNVQGKNCTVGIPGHNNNDSYAVSNFVSNNYHNSLLAEMMQTHITHDFCLIGSKGSGKSILTKKFASLLNYPYEMVMLYRDMTSRDLLQQRITELNGDTTWRLSQLVKGAQDGKLVILDGLHRLHHSTLSVLQRLVHDRELQLYDGTRLLRHDRYDQIKEKYGFSDEKMNEKNIFRIHPSFRIVALAEPPKIGSLKDQWLTPELLSVFLFHSVRPLSLKEEKHIIEQLVGPLNEKIENVLHFAHMLRNSGDEALVSLSAALSTRQLIRIARRLTFYPHENIHTLITQTCLTKFLPQLTKKTMENAIENAGIKAEEKNQIQEVCCIKDGKLFIGNTCSDIYNPGESRVKVPDILFYDNTEHIAVMEAMLQDFILGEHLLLIGNQGVGKNKITDRFLQLLNRPREYIQLHRDTTVQTLTQQPSVQDGRIIYEDSPLVKAVQNGYVLVVDEADKAPTHVTCILKALVESGEMVLSDGRSIVNFTDPRAQHGSKDIIVMHPEFRMIVLANRPGFPFLGNDFFATLGDIFSCHAVDNPSIGSEVAMLHQYGPDIPQYILTKLVKLFGELRLMSDQGLISYPYSTREAVNIVKHLQNFSNEGLSTVLKNVFDFDAFNNEMQETLSKVFHKHGIPFNAKARNIKLAKQFNLLNPYFVCHWSPNETIHESKATVRKLNITGPTVLSVDNYALDVTETRSDSFSEQQCYWQIPFDENNIPLDVIVTKAGKSPQEDIIHIVSANPLSVFSMIPNSSTLHSINLSKFFPQTRGAFQPKISMAALTSQFHGWILLHEKVTNLIFLLHPFSGQIMKVNISTILEKTAAKLSKTLHAEANTLQMCGDLSFKNIVMFYVPNGNRIDVLNFDTNEACNFHVPFKLKFISAPDEHNLIAVGQNNNMILVKLLDSKMWQLQEMKEELGNKSVALGSINSVGIGQINDDPLSVVLGVEKGTCATLLGTSNDQATLALDFPHGQGRSKVFSFPRESSDVSTKDNLSLILPKNFQIIRTVHPNNVPSDIKDEKINSGYLEVTDLGTTTYSYLPIPAPSSISSYASWLASVSGINILMCSGTDDSLVTVDAGGIVRIWETGKSSIQSSLLQWHKMIGVDENQLTIEHENPREATQPKHGKVDPTGAPHVGGNTWAGGTGGRDTAGLGGKGGPYRLDAGHTVFQLSDLDKDSVPLEVKKAAREMSQKAYKEKLKEIQMSEYDAELYERFLGNVKTQIQMLRIILDGLQAKSKERQWLKHQTSGELDDTKLIEGLTGEKSIYKRRGEQEPEMGSPQEKPKRLRLVVDVSGSMYRFNGHDNRLERELEATLMVMEALDGYQEKFQYDIVGHSGEDYCLEFSKHDHPPKNNKERLDIIKTMYVHSQYCVSGDHTLPATEHAIKTITKDEADEYFVVVLSDANLDRYGISPQSFGKVLMADSKVNAFAIFIGSLGNQAQRLSKLLPAGRGFVCFNTKDLPQVLQQIFTSTLLKD